MTKPAKMTIFLVIRSPGNRKVIGELLSEQGFDHKSVLQSSDLAHLKDVSHPRAALVDVSGYGSSIWSACEQLRSEEVPFIVLSTADALGVSGRALEYGAISILQKPIAKSALMNLLKSLDSLRNDQDAL